jgi:hypothetical protein
MCTDWTEQASIILALARRTPSKTAGTAGIPPALGSPGAPVGAPAHSGHRQAAALTSPAALGVL